MTTEVKEKRIGVKKTRLWRNSLDSILSPLAYRNPGSPQSNRAAGRKVFGGAAYGARLTAATAPCLQSFNHFLDGEEGKWSWKRTGIQLTDVKKGFFPLSCFPLPFHLKIVPGLVVFFLIPKKSHLIFPFGKGKTVSQWQLVHHTQHAFIPLYRHKPKGNT